MGVYLLFKILEGTGRFEKGRVKRKIKGEVNKKFTQIAIGD